MMPAPALLNPREKKLPCCEHSVWQRVKCIVLSGFHSIHNAHRLTLKGQSLHKKKAKSGPKSYPDIS